ncbi:hypothetical protein BC826DRAFT_1157852 [Russula brevipes]|nr:hypothetical protein BC826DRAFT_1157852 [Russula brevipes]
MAVTLSKIVRVARPRSGDFTTREPRDMGKQKKRKIVPAALHSEISEYSSLLRALRATDTLDITTQLTRLDFPSSQRRTSEEPGRPESPTLSHVDRRDDLSPSGERKDHSLASGASFLPRKSHSTWTRWPLLAEDLHIPEWTFEDEVHTLAKQALLSGLSTSDQLSANDPSQLRSIDSDAPSEDQIEALLPPSSLRTLADVPLVDKSVQHRRHPMRWESVLNIVGAAGLVDGNGGLRRLIISVIRNVKSRLEVIYGSHLDSSDITIDVPERLAMATLQDLDSANFFDGGNPEKRRKRGPYKKLRPKP